MAQTRAILFLWAALALPAQVVTLFQDNFTTQGTKLNTADWTTEFGNASFIPRTQFSDWVNGNGQFPVDASGARLALQTYNPTAGTPGDSFYGTLAKTKDKGFVPKANTAIELTVRMQLVGPIQPGLVFGIYFYGCTNGPCGTSHDEIGIELVTNSLQDAPLMVQLNRFANEPLNEGHGGLVPLPPGFDPLAAHDWTVRWSLNRIDYLVDGKLLGIATTFIPPRPMEVNINAWAPGQQWPAAFNGTLLPVSTAQLNRLFIAQVRSVTVKEITTPQRLRFVPLTPCRVMETRAAYNFEGRTGSFGPPSLTQGETRRIVFPNSTVCQIPAEAKAYAVNVTLIPSTPAGVDFVTVYPADELKPDVYTVRSLDGQIVANSTVVKAQSGAINVYASQSTDLIIDIAGYFTDAPGAQSNLVFYPLAPCRVVETRAAYPHDGGVFGPPSIGAGQTRSIRFPSSPRCPIPTGATAYSISLTVVPPKPVAFMTIWPTGSARPNVSSINSLSSRVVTNHVIVPAGTNDSIDIFAFDETDFIIDINGYFAPDDGNNGLFYYPVTQARLLDTRLANGNCGGPMLASETARTVPFPTCAGTPANAKAYHFTATSLSAGASMPFLTAWPTGQPRPNTSILNAFEGQIVTNSALIPSGTNGALDIFAFRQTNVLLDINGYLSR